MEKEKICRENCKNYDGNSGCKLNSNKWCMPWGKCILHEKKVVNNENN